MVLGLQLEKTLVIAAIRCLIQLTLMVKYKHIQYTTCPKSILISLYFLI